MADLLEGHIRFGSDAVAFSSATVIVTLADTTDADTAAVPLARTILTDTGFDGDPRSQISFRIERVSVPPGRTSTLRALIDLDGDGRASPGDFVSTQSVPIDQHTGQHVTIDVIRVRPRP